MITTSGRLSNSLFFAAQDKQINERRSKAMSNHKQVWSQTEQTKKPVNLMLIQLNKTTSFTIPRRPVAIEEIEGRIDKLKQKIQPKKAMCEYTERKMTKKLRNQKQNRHLQSVKVLIIPNGKSVWIKSF